MVAAAIDKEGQEQPSSLTPKSELWLLTLRGDYSHGHIQKISKKSPHHYDIGNNIPALVGKQIACAYYEWLVVTDSKSPVCFLLNLISEELIPLPPADFDFRFCILSSTPSDPGCRVVFFKEDETTFLFCRPGVDEKFAEQAWNYEKFITQKFAIVEGKIYFNGDPMSLVSIEFEEQPACRLTKLELHWERFPPVDESVTHYGIYLVGYSGDLFRVKKFVYGYYTENVAGFQVFKADWSKEEWVEVKSIAPIAIFIDGDGNARMCCPTIDSEVFRPNSINFFRDTDLYTYNLEDGSITMYPTRSAEKSSDDNNFTFQTWMMLPHDTALPHIHDMVQNMGGSKREDQLDREELFQEVERQEKSWSGLLPDLLSMILSNLFARDCVVFRAVCKSWQQLTTQHLIHSPTILQEQSCAPMLMFQENRINDLQVYKLFDPIHNRYHYLEIPKLRGAYIRYSRHGWLLASRRDGSLFFLNPVTQETVKLPRMPPDNRIDLLSFSSPPTSSDCLVAAMSDSGGNIWILKRGKRDWRETFIDIDPDESSLVPCTPVVHKGLHYYMLEDRRMVVCNFQDGCISSNVYSTSLQRALEDLNPCYDDDDEFMVEIDGMPALVVVPRTGEGISIFKWDDSKKDWGRMEDNNLGNKDMFLSRQSSFLASVDYGGGMGNKIFLPMLDDAKNDGVFYSLKTHKYHTFYSGYSEKKFYYAAKLSGIWLKPLWTRSGDNLKW